MIKVGTFVKLTGYDRYTRVAEIDKDGFRLHNSVKRFTRDDVDEFQNELTIKEGMSVKLRSYSLFVEVTRANRHNEFTVEHSSMLFTRDDVWCAKDEPAPNLHNKGAKDDALKPLPQVVLGGFANALQGVTEIGTFGARKYTRDGWKSVPDAQDRYTGALLRHLLEHLAGRTIDEESGFSHLRHIAWNALALTELDEIK